jgi:L-alanine-DL-glutamate epimerase-like enolase superfamily enzyme
MSRLPRIVGFEARDVRFPTSRWLDGSDAMHTDPDYSAAYVVLRTDADDGVEGHGLTFTSGRGTEVCVAAAHALEPFVVGRTLDGIVGDMSGFWRSLVSDSQLRWIGPEKGAIHLATAAVVNAVWDLWAKIERKPLWKLLVDLTPEVAQASNATRLVDRYDLLLMGRTMSPFMFNTLVDYIATLPNTNDGRRERVQNAIWLIMSSPEYAIER